MAATKRTAGNHDVNKAWGTTQREALHSRASCNDRHEAEDAPMCCTVHGLHLLPPSLLPHQGIGGGSNWCWAELGLGEEPGAAPASSAHSFPIQLHLCMGKLAAEFIFSRHVSSDLVPVSEKQFYLRPRQREAAGEHRSLSRGAAPGAAPSSTVQCHARFLSHSSAPVTKQRAAASAAEPEYPAGAGRVCRTKGCTAAGMPTAQCMASSVHRAEPLCSMHPALSPGPPPAFKMF